MKFNTIVFDANLPTTQQVNVPTNSDYKVGMKVKRNGEVQILSPSDFTITDTDGNTLSVDQEKTNGYVTITKASGDEATFKQYGVTVDADMTYVVNEYVRVQQGTTGGPYVIMDIDLSHLAGTTITPDQLFLAVKQSTGSAPEPPSRE